MTPTPAGFSSDGIELHGDSYVADAEWPERGCRRLACAFERLVDARTASLVRPPELHGASR